MTLSAPAVRPLLGDEHQDALSALSALLGQMDTAAHAPQTTTQAADQNAVPLTSAESILQQLSPPTASIDLDPAALRRRVA